MLNFSLSSFFNSSLIFGLVLLLGLISGELIGKTRCLPKIFGYLMAGFLLGPGCGNLVNASTLTEIRPFFDICLGFILFHLGRHLDWRWLRNDLSLLAMSLAESAFTWLLTFAALFLMGSSWILAALAATVAMATAPAVIMLVTHDLSAQGPVTRRIWILTSLNNFFSLVLFSLLLPLADPHMTVGLNLFISMIYPLLSSFLVAFFMLGLTKLLTRVMGKNSIDPFILMVTTTILAIGVSRSLHLSVMLTLFIYGALIRRFNRHHQLNEINFYGWSRIFLISLFLFTGISLELHDLWKEAVMIGIFVLIRAIAKSLGIYAFAKSGRLTLRQSVSLAMAIMPMASMGVGVSVALTDINPNLGHTLATIIGGALAVLTLLGPVAVQIALLKSGETTDEKYITF